MKKTIIMNYGLCIATNFQKPLTFAKLITENSAEQLQELLSNEYFSKRINEDLKINILKSKASEQPILLDTANSKNKQLLTELCIWNKYKWNNGSILRVKFLSNNPFLEAKIFNYAKEWENYANIKFQLVKDEDAEIRISLIENFTSWSYIGKDCLQYSQDVPTMNFGWFLHNNSDIEIKRVTLHEFGHALGCIHEHQHPKANIPWDTNAVRRVYTAALKWTEASVQHNILSSFPPEELSNSDYDSNSIMHYFFPKELTLNKTAFKENFILSENDKYFISKLYPKTEKQESKSILS